MGFFFLLTRSKVFGFGVIQLMSRVSLVSSTAVHSRAGSLPKCTVGSVPAYVVPEGGACSCPCAMGAAQHRPCTFLMVLCSMRHSMKEGAQNPLSGLRLLMFIHAKAIKSPVRSLLHLCGEISTALISYDFF